MSKKNKIATTSTLTPDQRMSDEHLFSAMYSERQVDDASKNKAAPYDSNPDARMFYAKGVYDILKFLQIMFEENVPFDECERMLGIMRNQAKDESHGVTSH